MNDDIDVYLHVRAKEGRLYSDEVVKRLPAVPEDHPLRSEWVRQGGFQRETCRLSAPVQEAGYDSGSWVRQWLAITPNGGFRRRFRRWPGSRLPGIAAGLPGILV